MKRPVTMLVIVVVALLITGTYYIFSAQAITQITGYVLNIDGTAGISGVTITAYNATNGSLIQAVVTDSSGFYNFTDLPFSGDYNFTVQKAGYITRNFSNLTAPGSFNLSIFLEDHGSYTITVLDVQNNRPIPNALVNITWAEGTINKTGRTNASGMLVLEVPANTTGGSSVTHNFTSISDQGYNTNNTELRTVFEGTDQPVTLYMTGGCPVVGYVRDAHRVANIEISGASVALWANTNQYQLNFSDTYFYNETTSASGYYSIYVPNTLLGGGTNCNPFIHTSATGYNSDTLSQQQSQVPEFNITLTGSSTINGTVQDAHAINYLIGDATVKIISLGTVVYQDTTSAQGTFSIAVKSEENKTIEIEKSGYETFTNLTSFNNSMNFNPMYLEGSGNISGTIVDKQNQSIVISSANITLTQSTTGATYSLQSDANGRFNTNISTNPASYTVLIHNANGYNDNDTVSFSFSAAGVTENRNIGTILLTGKNQINGTVYDSINLIDTTVENVSVTVTGAGNVYQNILTNANGFFNLYIPSTIAPYTISFDLAGYNISTTSSSQVSGNTLDVFLVGATRVRGQATDVYTSNPVQDVAISFYNPLTNITYYNTSTDSNGDYQLDIGVDFDFSIRAEKTGYQTYTNGTHQWDQQRTGPDIVDNPLLNGSSIITLILHDNFNTSRLLDNAEICVLYEGSGYSSCEYSQTSDVNGSSVFNIRGEENYRIRLDRLGYLQKFIPSSSTSMIGNHTNTSETLSAHAVVSVKDLYAVQNQQNIPQANVYLYRSFNDTLFNVTLNETIANVTATCDGYFAANLNTTLRSFNYTYNTSLLTDGSIGNLTFRRVSIGDLNLSVNGTNAGCSDAFTTVTVTTAGQSYHFSIDVVGSSLTLFVNSPNFPSGVSGANVSLLNRSNDEIALSGNLTSLTGLSNLSGHVLFTYVIPGEYTVNVTSGSASVEKNITVGISGSQTLTLNDSFIPNFTTIDISDSTPTDGDQITANVLWFDDGVLEAAVIQTNESGTFQNCTSLITSSCPLVAPDFSGNRSWANFTINTSGLAGQSIGWRIIANDTTGNINDTMPTQSFRVSDNVAPNITITYSPGNPTGSLPIRFDVSANDTSNLTNIKIFVDYALVKTCTFSAGTTNGTCNITLGPFEGDSKHYFYATAEDTEGNVGRDPQNAEKIETLSPTLAGITRRAVAVYDTINQSVFIFGGAKGNPLEYYNTIQIYEPISTSVRTSSATLPYGRESAAAVYQSVNNTVEIFGGYNDSFINQTVRYNSSQDSASILGATIPQSARSGMTAVFSNVTNETFIFGGLNNSPAEYIDQIVIYHPHNNTFTIAGETLPSKRMEATSAFDSNTSNVTIFGGYNGSGIKEIIEYDPSADTVVVTGSLPSVRWGSSAAYYPITGVSYVIGGCGESSSTTNQIVLFDPVSNDVNVSSTSFPAGLGSCYTTAVFNPINNSILIFGGYDFSVEYNSVVEYTPINAHWLIVDPLTEGGDFDSPSLTVTVTDDRANPVENAVVSIAGPTQDLGVTDSSGQITFTPEEGLYTISTNGALQGYGSNVTAFNVVSGSNELSVSINQTELLVRIEQADGSPILNANVTLYNNTEATQVAYDAFGQEVTGFTNATGHVFFTRVLPCSGCNLSVRKTVNSVEHRNSTLVSVNGGDQKYEVIDPPGNVFGQSVSIIFIINDNDNDADNVNITLFDNTTGAFVATQFTVDGNTTFNNLAVGSYSAHITGHGVGFTNDIIFVAASKEIITSGQTDSSGFVTLDIDGTIGYHIFVSVGGYHTYDDLNTQLTRVGTYDSNGIGTQINGTALINLTGGVFVSGAISDVNFVTPVTLSYEPVPNATVGIYTQDCDGTLRYSPTTYANGTYETYISPRQKTSPSSNQTYCIKASASGFTDSSGSFRSNIEFNTSLTEDISLDGNESVSGTVLNKVTMQPVTTATVTLKSNECFGSSSQCTAYQKTVDGSGFFSHLVNPTNSPVPYIPYTMQIDADSFQNFSTNVTLGTNENYLICPRGVSFIDVNVTSAFGDEITNITNITLFSPTKGTRVLENGTNDCTIAGNVLSCQVADDNYNLTVNGSFVGYGVSHTYIGLPYSSCTFSQDIILDVTSFNATLTSDAGTQVNGVTVTLTNVSGTEFSNVTVSADGEVLIRRVPVGQYTVTFSGNLTDVFSFNSTNQAQITITPAGSVVNVTYVFNETRMKITLFNTTNASLANINLTLTNSNATIQNQTIADGSALLRAVLFGNYSLFYPNESQLYVLGYRPENLTIPVIAGQNENGTNNVSVHLPEIQFQINLSNQSGAMTGVNISVFLNGSLGTTATGRPMTELTDTGGVALFNRTIPYEENGLNYTYVINANASGFGILSANTSVLVSGKNITHSLTPLIVNITVLTNNGSVVTSDINLTIVKNGEIQTNSFGTALHNLTQNSTQFTNLFVDDYTLNINSTDETYFNQTTTFTTNTSTRYQNITIFLEEAGYGYFNVTVNETDGDPISAATVSVTNGTVTITSGSTDARGVVLLTINVSEYSTNLTLQASKSGFDTNTAGPFNISEGVTNQTSITLTATSGGDSGGSGGSSGGGGGGGGGGGSGGGGGGGVSCTENWSCQSWSTCSSGVQTRICTDSNNCGTTASRPVVSQSCVAALETNASSVLINANQCLTTTVTIVNTGTIPVTNLKVNDSVIAQCCTVTSQTTISSLSPQGSQNIGVTICADKSALKGEFTQAIPIVSNEKTQDVTLKVTVSKEYAEVLLDQINAVQKRLQDQDSSGFDITQHQFAIEIQEALERATQDAQNKNFNGAEGNLKQAEDLLDQLLAHQPVAFVFPFSPLMFIVPVIAVILFLMWFFVLRKPQSLETGSPTYPLMSKQQKSSLLSAVGLLEKRISQFKPAKLGKLEKEYHGLIKTQLSAVKGHIRNNRVIAAGKSLTLAEKHLKLLESGQTMLSKQQEMRLLSEVTELEKRIDSIRLGKLGPSEQDYHAKALDALSAVRNHIQKNNVLAAGKALSEAEKHLHFLESRMISIRD